jgi:hypothetical protein
MEKIFKIQLEQTLLFRYFSSKAREDISGDAKTSVCKIVRLAR